MIKKVLTMANATPLLYKSVDPIINVLEKPEHNAMAGVKDLLNIYLTTKEKNKTSIAAGDVKKHPLIILEGLDGSGKSTVGVRFAKKINGIKWETAPKSISHLRNMFDENALLRTAFYSLGNYIAGLEIEMLLKESPVVMDRYWHSTAAFALAQAVQDYPNEYKLPPKGDEIYEWPKDLFKPDIVILLDVDEDVRLKRLSRRTEITAQENLLRTCSQFRNDVLLAYKNMVNPSVTFINGNSSFETEMQDLYEQVKHLLIENSN